MKKLLVTLGAVAAVTMSANAAVIVLGDTERTANTWIRSDSPGIGGGVGFNYVGSLNGDALRGITTFDISGIADTAIITSVTVTFTQSSSTNASGGTSATYDIDLIGAPAGSFSNSSTWNGANAVFDTATIMGTISADPTAVTGGTAFTFGSTSALVSHVQAALVGDDLQFGLISEDLEALTERSFFAFGTVSPEPAVAQPTVTIEYIPEPSSAALLGLGGIAIILRRRK